MPNPFRELGKLRGRSLRELAVRGRQRISVFKGKVAPPKPPGGDTFRKIVDPAWFKSAGPSAEEVAEVFHATASGSFFPVFRDREASAESFRTSFRGRPVAEVTERAKRILEGRFDLLGHKGLDLGTDVDWRTDPLSGIRTEGVHWSLLSETDLSHVIDLKVLWEANRHQHFFTLGAAYMLTREQAYAETFARHVEGWMEQNPPETGVNWMSSLELAFRAMSWIWAMNLFAGAAALGPDLTVRMVAWLHLHGLHIERHLSTYYSPNTHLTGEALGLYYLGTQLPFLKDAARWRRLGERVLVREADRQVFPDGVYFEQSTWYHRYTLDFLTHFLLLREYAVGGKMSEPVGRLARKTESMAAFLMHVMRPDGTTPLVGDDDGGRCLPLGSNRADDFRGSLSTCAVLFDRDDLKHAAGQALEETFWLLGPEGLERFRDMTSSAPEKTSVAFSDGGWFVMKDGSGETDNFMLIDCGELGSLSGAHGHADALSFELAVAGRTALLDPGTFTYHGSDELREHFRSSRAHNTLVVDGESQSVSGGKFSWSGMAKSTPAEWVSEDRFDFFEGSHDGYERLDDPVTHTRSILFLKNEYWIMRDLARASERHEYALNFQFNVGARPAVSRLDDCWAVDDMPEDGTGLRLITVGDEGGWQMRDSHISRNHGERLEAPCLRFVAAGEGPQEFFTFMFPTEQGFDPAEVSEKVVSGGREFSMRFRGYRDVLTFNDTGAGVRLDGFSTDFRFVWTRLGYSGAPEEMVLIGGSRLLVGGRMLVDEPSRVSHAVVRFLGDVANVRTPSGAFSVGLGEVEGGILRG